MTKHPSRLTLERSSVDDLPEAQAREVSEHVRDCDECTRCIAELTGARERLLAAVPAERFTAQVAARRDRVVRLRDRRLPRIAAGITALAAAAALLVLVRRPPSGDGETPGIALKGGGASVYRSRDGQVHALTSEDTIRAGDALRVTVTQASPTRVAAWFVDAHGQVDRVFPDGVMLVPAGESSMPGSAVVDSPCVDLDLIMLTNAPASIVDLERRLHEAADGGPSPNGDVWVPPGAWRRHLRCE